jgi:serine/threonine protein kinase
MQFEPGMRITDTIQLREMVGEGGMGQIWAAEHLLLRRPVAIKRLASQFADNVEALQRFAAEAQAGARMESANVTRVFDYALLADGTPFMVMELLEGVELYSRVRDGRTLSLEETTRVVVQMCAALALIHDAGIVHRDVKPENIFLVPSKAGGFTVKLLDFGIAKGGGAVDCEELAKAGATVLGTPAYMSPEQLENAGEVDARADLWSLAVVVYCCLTGTMPFNGDSLVALGYAIRSGEFAAPTELKPDLPSAIDAWFRKALDRKRNARFASAAEMAEAFVEAAKTKPASQQRPRLELIVTPPQSQAIAIPARPHRVSALGLFTAVAALAATAATFQPELVLNWSTVSLRPLRRAVSSAVQLAHAIPTTIAAGSETAGAPWAQAGAPPRPRRPPTVTSSLAP